MEQQNTASRERRRLFRQFDMLVPRIPTLRQPIQMLLRDGWALARLPLALLMTAGGLLSFLPFLGLWMLPLGLLLLAVDIPAIRPTVSALAIRGRRWATALLRWFRSHQA